VGLSLSFIASQGPDPLESLGLSADGKTLRAEPLPPPAKFVAFNLGGWRVVMSDDHRFASRERVSAAAQGGVAIGVYMEEHVMVSGAFGAKDGQLTWSVQHDPEQGLEHLDVWGDPPGALASIRERLLAELQEDDEVDTLFSAPLDLAAGACGFHPHEFEGEVDLTILSVARKDLMKMHEPALPGDPGSDRAAPATTAAATSRPGFLARLFGRR
jgi:hypothetical protein